MSEFSAEEIAEFNRGFALAQKYEREHGGMMPEDLKEFEAFLGNRES